MGVLIFFGCLEGRTNVSFAQDDIEESAPSTQDIETDVSISQEPGEDVSSPPDAGEGVSVPQDGAEFHVVVQRESFAFDPPILAIEVGDTVSWTNNDKKRHLTASVPGTYVSPTGTRKDLEIYCPKFHPDTVCTHTFTVPGKYPYFCFIHKNMVGEIIVLEK